MPHNRASQAMFRYRSQAIFAAIAIVAAFCAPMRSGQFAGVNHTLTGVDMYDFMNSEPFAGKRVGLITNQTGVDSQGYSTIHLFAGRKDVKLVAIFSPEHGISGKVDAAVADGKDATSGVPIYSLYGETRRPTDEMLKGIDVLLFDVQDAGVRFYTYITTMAYCMEAAAKHH
ncbi:MAG: exo-beta-N-acetylmuramidase NamZ domain-containing protein, partial [Candidatus Acidiferrales bacterium]